MSYGDYYYGEVGVTGKNVRVGSVVVQSSDIKNSASLDNSANSKLAVVLFKFYDYSYDKDYVCTCPLTSNPYTARKHPEEYYYSPNLFLDEKENSCVKISSANFHSLTAIHPTGMYIDEYHINEITEKIRCYQPTSGKVERFEKIKRNLFGAEETTLDEDVEYNKPVDKKAQRQKRKIRNENRRQAKMRVSLD